MKSIILIKMHVCIIYKLALLILSCITIFFPDKSIEIIIKMIHSNIVEKLG